MITAYTTDQKLHYDEKTFFYRGEENLFNITPLMRNGNARTDHERACGETHRTRNNIKYPIDNELENRDSFHTSLKKKQISKNFILETLLMNVKTVIPF